MKEKLIIVGTNTTANHVYEFVKSYDMFDVLGFAVDQAYKKEDTFCDLPVYAIEELKQWFDMTEVKLFVAILWNRLNADRRMVYERLKADGYQFANIIAPTAVVRGKVPENANCWLHDYVVVQPAAEVGENCLLMAFALVGPYARLGSHCFMGTKSTVAGTSNIGEQTFVGINCTVFDGTNVGKKCILGACTSVKRNVEDYSLVRTNLENTSTIQMEEDTIESKLLFKKNVR